MSMHVLFRKAQNDATRKRTKWHHFPLDPILGTTDHFNDLKPCSFRPLAYSELSFLEVLFGKTSLWLSPICKKINFDTSTLCWVLWCLHVLYMLYHEGFTSMELSHKYNTKTKDKGTRCWILMLIMACLFVCCCRWLNS